MTATTNPRVLERVLLLARYVSDNPNEIGALSTGERIVTALVLNRLDDLPSGYRHVLDAIERLDPGWLEAAVAARLHIRHHGWGS